MGGLGIRGKCEIHHASKCISRELPWYKVERGLRQARAWLRSVGVRGEGGAQHAIRQAAKQALGMEFASKPVDLTGRHERAGLAGLWTMVARMGHAIKHIMLHVTRTFAKITKVLTERTLKHPAEPHSMPW